MVIVFLIFYILQEDVDAPSESSGRPRRVSKASQAVKVTKSAPKAKPVGFPKPIAAASKVMFVFLMFFLSLP